MKSLNDHPTPTVMVDTLVLNNGSIISYSTISPLIYEVINGW